LSAKAARFSAKAVLAKFQKGAFASGLVAMAASPIPPARASGDIRKKGTAVETILIESAWAKVFLGSKTEQPIHTPKATNNLLGAIFIQSEIFA
jgi:hypothetical protein